MSDKNQQGEQISTKGSEKKWYKYMCLYIYINSYQFIKENDRQGQHYY